MTNAEIFDVLHEYVEYATGLPGKDIRITRPNYGLNPSNDRGTIVTIGIIDPVTIGIDGVFYVDGEAEEDMAEIISADRNITASIKTYGDDAADVMGQISQKLRGSNAQAIFYRGGIGFIRRGTVLQISEILNGSFEEIRQLDVEFHVNHIVEEDVKAIDSATIELEVQHETKKLNATIEVTR